MTLLGREERQPIPRFGSRSDRYRQLAGMLVETAYALVLAGVALAIAALATAVVR